jgi:hypothetical protein
VRYLTFDRWFQYASETFKRPNEEQTRTAWKAIIPNENDPEATHLGKSESDFYFKVSGYHPLRTR